MGAAEKRFAFLEPTYSFLSHFKLIFGNLKVQGEAAEPSLHCRNETELLPSDVREQLGPGHESEGIRK